MRLQRRLMMKKKTGGFYVLETANDIKIVLGNFNAQVGKEAVSFPTVGN